MEKRAKLIPTTFGINQTYPEIETKFKDKKLNRQIDLMTINRRQFITRGILGVGGVMLADSFLLEKYWIEKNEFDLQKNPNELPFLKFIQISDLHLKDHNPALPALADFINSSKPDLIVLTGDSIEHRNGLPFLETFLNQLNYEIPKVAILGNWEYWGGVKIEKLKKLYSRFNVQLLINQSTQLIIKDKKISIIGTDDWRCGTPDYNLFMEGYEPGDFNLLLTHCPIYRDHIPKEIYDKAKTDLVLSGHTHGGQFNLFGYTPFKPYGSGKYVKGWYKEKFPPLYVSKGIGTSRLPFRFGARAEITIFNV